MKKMENTQFQESESWMLRSLQNQLRTLRILPVRRMSSIHNAAILIIGDEILNGKIKDTNSHFFATTLFNKGIEVKKILVVGDEEDEIVESLNALRKSYDFVITSGGIGPTHDDITYEAIAKAHGLPLKLHQETVNKMQKLRKSNAPVLNEQELKAQHRMAIFPYSESVEVIYLSDDLWVPVVGLDSRVYILPGVPQLFQKLLTYLVDHFDSRIPVGNKFIRYYVKTTLSESQIAPHLQKLQQQSDDKGIKIGSYPHMGLKFTTISFLGRNKHNDYIRSLVNYAVENLEGVVIDTEEEQINSDNLDEEK